MVQTIIIGSQTLEVKQIYPYRYEYGQGKEVLRIDIERSKHEYTTIEYALENPIADIKYCEDGTLVNTYKGYNRDFKCSYQNGVYSVEVTRISELELKVNALEAQVAELTATKTPEKSSSEV